MERMTREGFEAFLVSAFRPDNCMKLFQGLAPTLNAEDKDFWLLTGDVGGIGKVAYNAVRLGQEFFVEAVSPRENGFFAPCRKFIVQPLDRANIIYTAKHPLIPLGEMELYNVDSESLIVDPGMPLRLEVELQVPTPIKGQLTWTIQFLYSGGSFGHLVSSEFDGTKIRQRIDIVPNEQTRQVLSPHTPGVYPAFIVTKIVDPQGLQVSSTTVCFFPMRIPDDSFGDEEFSRLVVEDSQQ